MHIPFIYVLFIAEALLVLLALSIILGIIAYKLYMRKDTSPSISTHNEHREINLGSSYSELLAIEIMKNQTRVQHDKNAENDPATNETSSGKKHSKLLHIRELFLNTERDANQQADNDILFWQKIYDGINNIAEHLKTIQYEATTLQAETTVPKNETTEKVFYIETQGKKVDGEVNRLKDIIFEQENTLSAMIKALKTAESSDTNQDNNEPINALRTQVENFERQLRDSKTCMEVLELENNRLQEELHKIDNNQTTSSNETESGMVDIQSMRDMLEKQERRISSLNTTIDELTLSTEQTEKLKSTLNEFAHSSREMMSCISILEEENERLKLSTPDQVTATEAGGDNSELKTKIKKMEEEIIKKDVAYAKLQDEFTSMEKEYLAMYNAMHGNNT